MFGIGKSFGGGVLAVVDVASGSAGVVLVDTKSMNVLAQARESLPLEQRSDDALAKGVLQALATAVDRAIKDLNSTGQHQVGRVYCIVGSPWSRSAPGKAATRSEKELVITDPMIADLAKQALADQKVIDRGNLLEANVVRVLLNGYPTDEPAGKRAEEVDVFTLLSDCDPTFKNSIQEALSRSMPDAPITWRSSARAALMATKASRSQDSLVAILGEEATDAIIVRKGVLTDRALIPQGMRQIASSFAEGKPVEETLALLDMLEKDQCEDESCKALEASIAKQEPELAHSFGETFAKLSTQRKLPDDMLLVAPAHLVAWGTRFFSRIDFTQFTTSARPFTVMPLSLHALSNVPKDDLRLAADSGLSLACALVNIELTS